MARAKSIASLLLSVKCEEKVIFCARGDEDVGEKTYHIERMVYNLKTILL